MKKVSLIIFMILISLLFISEAGVVYASMFANYNNSLEDNIIKEDKICFYVEETDSKLEICFYNENGIIDNVTDCYLTCSELFFENDTSQEYLVKIYLNKSFDCEEEFTINQFTTIPRVLFNRTFENGVMTPFVGNRPYTYDGYKGFYVKYYSTFNYINRETRQGIKDLKTYLYFEARNLDEFNLNNIKIVIEKI